MSRSDSGQMTVELCIVFPAALIVALITVNALAFFSECSAFDRVGRNAVRAVAAAPAHGQDVSQSISQVKSELEREFEADNLDIDVAAEGSFDGTIMISMTLRYRPTLFGMGMRDEILGVATPAMTHISKLAVDPYKPGIFF